MAGMSGGAPHRADRILGCGVLLSGCVLLGIGLILGLEFPRYVIDQKMKTSCVTGADTQHYRDWLSSYNSTGVSLLTIWPANAKSGLGRTPPGNRKRFGPYVFTSDERKVDLSGHDGLLLFRVYSQYRFDEDGTRRQCATCHDHDEVTVVSTVRQQLLAPFAGSKAVYLRRHIAAMARALLHSRSTRQVPRPAVPPARGAPTDRPTSVSLLTCRLVALDSKLLRLAPPELLVPALRLLEEPAGVVRAPLTDRVCDEVWKRVLREAVVTEEWCKEYRTGEAAHCDVWFFVERHSRLNETQRGRVANVTVQLLCCHSNYSQVGRSSPSALLSLVLQLAPRLQQAVADVSSLNLLTNTLRGPVSQMALGFRLRTALFTNNSVSCWDLPERTVLEDGWISGALRHHESEQHSRRHASLRSLSTCLYNRSKESNLLWHDRVTVTGRRLPRHTAGFSSSLPPATHVTACGRSATTAAAAAIYEPRVWRPLQYVRSGRSASLGQVALMELTAPEANASLYDMRDVSEFAEWIQLGPLDQQQHQSLSEYIPKVLVEPLSGHIWSRSITWTSYTGQNASSLVPLWTVTQHWQVSDDVITRHRWQSIVILEVGCAGLVTCSLVGGLAVLAGYLVFLGFISCRGSAVAPLMSTHR
ncbi:uncharacterized protein LOC122376228 [Amphibalanus amphitrite]|uniref:uncharacterized protein LOC122376228 n=1 Tax=Amphibalanus amphitrite TaxID=1232801 RepID=UPI001C9105D9|nr:uncharacterized protein LOC122376228 [Amphibalanus amphitrite]